MNSNEKYTNPKDVLGAGKVPLELFPPAAMALISCSRFPPLLSVPLVINWR